MIGFIRDCLRTPSGSSPRDGGEGDTVEKDGRVVTKAAEIRVRRPQHLALELENAVAVENLELQEQQSDRKELEDTLVKLEKHKDKLVQQIKTVRQHCYEESQQILSLQADEMQKESQVEEYERELARARWRLKKLREEVRQAKRKVEEAGERDVPLQDSIRQSYEEILQEEHTLCSLSGGAVTPESQLEESTSPADTTEDDLLPLKPWGRSQSLPAYADLIMRVGGPSFCNNLANTREEMDDSGSSSTKMDPSDTDYDPDPERETNSDGESDRLKEEAAAHEKPVSQLDFYQADPFTHGDHDLFKEDLFPEADSSDGFTSDPFKGSDPFAADVLFPALNRSAEDDLGNVGEEADTSLSCAENKASTGTQCFESEFPDEDSDIEISYSREDLDAVADESHRFKPIQSSSEELGAEPVQGWRSQGQFSVESDPNGYELDLGNISPPSDIEEHSLGSLAGEFMTEKAGEEKEGVKSDSAGTGDAFTEPVLLESADMEHTVFSQEPEWANNFEEKLENTSTPHNSAVSENPSVQPDSNQNRALDMDLSYEDTHPSSSFDPYGFKLSPEHSSHTLLDPDEAELSPELADNDLTFDPQALSPQPDQLDFELYEFGITASQVAQDSDPYGFKLSPEPENQEVLNLCSHDHSEPEELFNYGDNKQIEPSNESQQEPLNPENQEVLDSLQEMNVSNVSNQEDQDLFNTENMDLCCNENQELVDPDDHENQEVVETCLDASFENLLEPCDYDNQEVLEPGSYGSCDGLNFSQPENQEVPGLDNLDLGVSQDHELQGSGNHGNQEVLPEANNNQRTAEAEVSDSPTTNSSDSDVASDDLLGLELSNRTNSSAAHGLVEDVCVSSRQDVAASNTSFSRNLLEGDLSTVFGAGGYIGCADVADDLEPLGRRPAKPVKEPARPMAPVRPPRPSLRGKEKNQSKMQGIDLK
ncbi:uncharacterized protein LOC142881290 isoform X3 [Nelusetta ayraudi]|uniref:uncharacterized protein LOC142881290 isoform X3 n=1 Tax=Nelusetta ayraudi TaxID=303726 RepID=UPI003F6F9928